MVRLKLSAVFPADRRSERALAITNQRTGHWVACRLPGYRSADLAWPSSWQPVRPTALARQTARRGPPTAPQALSPELQGLRPGWPAPKPEQPVLPPALPVLRVPPAQTEQRAPATRPELETRLVRLRLRYPSW